MAERLHRMFEKERRNALEADMDVAKLARVARGADSADDDVEVTLPYTDSPTLRHDVRWSVGVQVVAGELQPRYPQRGDEGYVIELDNGDLWLTI